VRRNLGTSRSSTIGTEKLTNYALQIKRREDFIQQLTSNLPPRPEYFPQDAQINRAGATAIADLPELKPVAAEELKSLLEKGGIVVDVRRTDDFAAAHVPGSINIPLDGQFASWAGTLIGLKSQPVLIADSPEQLSEARVRLARIGLDEEHGYLQGGTTGWRKAGFELASIEKITARNLEQQLDSDRIQVLDVRRQPEWQAGHVEGAVFHPLDDFKAAMPQVDRNKQVAVICKSGYRSMIACSLLLRAGFEKVAVVDGGFDAWQKANLPAVSETPALA